MANSQDVLQNNPGGDAYDTVGGGEQTNQWGGQAARRIVDNSKYTGGWNHVQGDGYSFDNPTNPEQYAKQAYTYTPSGRQADVDRYRTMGEAAMGRGAPSLDYSGANANLASGGGALQQGMGQLAASGGYLDQGTQYLGSGMADRNAAGMARGDQYDALSLQQSAAMGNQPSQAQVLGQSMINQGLQSQLAGAASARGGPMQQAAAMRSAAGGAAAFETQGMGQLSAMRANEMAQARGDYQAGATGIRGQDYAGAAQATDMARATTGMATAGTGMANASTGIGNAYNGMAGTSAGMTNSQGQLEMGQRQLNQQDRQFYEGQAFNVNQAALNASMGTAAQAQQQQQFNAQMDQAGTDRTYNMIGAGLGAGATLGAAEIGAAGRSSNGTTPPKPLAKGGPMTPGRPYLVGERGPELIVPSRHGTVIPAGPTRHIMSMAEAAHLRQQADEMQAGYGQQITAGPAVGTRTMTLSPQIIDDAPEPGMGQAAALMGGRDYPAGPAPAPQAPLEHLMGGREDPYGPPIDRSDPWAGVQPREEGGHVAPGKPYLVGERGPEVIAPAPAPVYIDPRTGATHGAQAESARQTEAMGEAAASMMSPAAAVIAAGGELAADRRALMQRAAANPTVQRLAIEMPTAIPYAGTELARAAVPHLEKAGALLAEAPTAIPWTAADLSKRGVRYVEERHPDFAAFMSKLRGPKR